MLLLLAHLFAAVLKHRKGSSMKLKTGFALIVSAVVLSGTVIAPAAMAGTGSDCPNGQVCLYDYYSYDGLLGTRAPGMSRTAISAANNDKLASWINKTTTNAAWYREVSGGDCFTMAKNSTDSAMAIGFRDTASSWKTTGGC